MIGRAANSVQRVAHGNVNGDQDECDKVRAAKNLTAAQYPLDRYRFDRVLGAYERIFLAEAGSNIARTEFGISRQTEKESIQDWHSRVIILYQRAQPTGDLETTPELVHKFIKGMLHPAIVEKVTDEGPANMTDALRIATAKWATILDMRELAKTRPGFAKSGLNSIIAGMGDPATNEGVGTTGTNALSSIKCYGCGAFGHMKRNCRKTQQRGGRSRSFPPTRSSNFPPPPVQKGPPRRKFFPPRRSVNHLDAVEEESKEEMEEASFEYQPPSPAIAALDSPPNQGNF
jgi:hypothetical protein